MKSYGDIGELQTTYLDHLLPELVEDGRIRAAWLEGSLGRGNADRYSDIDLHLLLDPAQIEAFRSEAESWLGTISPLVLYRLLFNGQMINALTVDGLRIDIWLHDDGIKELNPAKVALLHQTSESVRFVENAQPVPDRAPALLDQIREFWRCIALVPSVIGRDERLVSLTGLGIEVKILADILVDGYQVPRDAGVKKLNAFLPDETRWALETAVGTVELTRTSLVVANLNLASILQEHGPIIAEHNGFDYPIELERSVLAHVGIELRLIGIPAHMG